MRLRTGEKVVRLRGKRTYMLTLAERLQEESHQEEFSGLEMKETQQY